MLGKTAAAYLRKSRMEEGMETKDVLQRNREWLVECAQQHGLDIIESTIRKSSAASNKQPPLASTGGGI